MRRNPLIPTIKVELFLKGKPVKTVIAFDAFGGYNFTKYFQGKGGKIDTGNPAIIIRSFADPEIPDDVTDRELLRGLPLTVAAEISEKAAVFLAGKGGGGTEVNPPKAGRKQSRRTTTISKPSPASTLAGRPNGSGAAISPAAK